MPPWQTLKIDALPRKCRRLPVASLDSGTRLDGSRPASIRPRAPNRRELSLESPRKTSNCRPAILSNLAPRDLRGRYSTPSYTKSSITRLATPGSPRALSLGNGNPITFFPFWAEATRAKSCYWVFDPRHRASCFFPKLGPIGTRHTTTRVSLLYPVHHRMSENAHAPCQITPLAAPLDSPT